MATSSWSAVLDMTTDAGFRAWVADYISHLSTVGLVQTADTGQINTATVTRPAVSTAAGYAIFRFNDTLQATAPIFLKIEFGTGNVAGRPAVWVTVGTGTNGAGTLTGSATARTPLFSTAAAGNATSAYPSYFCHTTGFLGVLFRVGWNGGTVASTGGFAVVRHNDTSGAPTDDGFTLYAPGQSTVITAVITQAVRTAAPAEVFAAAAQSDFSFCPHGISYSTTSDGDQQLLAHYTVTRKIRQVFAMVSYFDTEIGQGSTFTATPMGATARTFLATGIGFGYGAHGPTVTAGAAATRIAMLWE